MLAEVTKLSVCSLITHHKHRITGDRHMFDDSSLPSPSHPKHIVEAQGHLVPPAGGDSHIPAEDAVLLPSTSPTAHLAQLGSAQQA